MRNLKVLLFLTLLFLKNAEAQKIVEDIKPEKDFMKLTNYKYSSFIALDWTSDGKALIYKRDRMIRKYILEKGKEETLEAFDEVIELRVSPSGEKIAYLLEMNTFPSHQMIIIKSLLQKDTLLDIKRLPQMYDTRSFIWTLDEKNIIFPFAYGNEWSGLCVYIIEKSKLNLVRQPCSSIAFNPRNNKFYAIENSDSKGEKVFILLFDPTQNKLKKKIFLDVAPNAVEAIEDIDCKGDNILLTMSLYPPFLDKYGTGRQLVVYSIKEHILHFLTKGKANYFKARYSPDCKKIAFFSDRDGFVNIWLLDLEEKK